jgi:hypothetical protein
MANAVKTKGEAILEGSLAGEKIEAPTCPIPVFINFVDLAGRLVDFSLQDARCTHSNYRKSTINLGHF